MSASERRARAQKVMEQAAPIAKAMELADTAGGMQAVTATLQASYLAALVNAVLSVSEEMHITNVGMGFDE